MSTRARHPGTASRVTVLSYNIHSAVGRDGVCAPERIADVIQTAGGSIVGLQEVDARAGAGRGLDQFRYFAQRTGMRCIAGPNIVEHRGRYGNALLTVLPVERKRLIRLPAGSAREPRGAICAVLRCDTHRLQVITTHLGLGRAERREQVRILLEEAAVHNGPTLFMGDFNVWHRRRTVLTKLGAPADIGSAPRTFPARRPMFALDRIWTRPLGLLESVATVRNGLTLVASDHLPLCASVRLANPARGNFRTGVQS